jgi:6-pyruvoyltetrahydropterin/6-carboxytetrahydropterin synthase
MKHQSTKIFDGFSTVFRQWRAKETHCSYLHGYGIWVWDFGGMKRAKTQIDGMSPKAWMDYMFDHTLIAANDDPELDSFRMMDAQGLIQLRVIDDTGAEKFAEYIYNKLNSFVEEETDGRVRVTQVEFMEHGKNTAIYGE